MRVVYAEYMNIKYGQYTKSTVTFRCIGLIYTKRQFTSTNCRTGSFFSKVVKDGGRKSYCLVLTLKSHLVKKKKKKKKNWLLPSNIYMLKQNYASNYYYENQDVLFVFHLTDLCMYNYLFT